MTAAHGWRLERNDRHGAFFSANHVDLFVDSGGPGFRPDHPAQPAWKAIVGLNGQVEISAGCTQEILGGGVLVPPDTPHASARSAGHATLAVPQWMVGRDLPRSPSLLPVAACRELLDVLRVDSRTPDLHAGVDLLRIVLGKPSRLDPRVMFALQNVMRFRHIGDLATAVELSAPRLRTMVHRTAGVPLVQVRHMEMLRSAVGHIDLGLARAAQEGGFADQSHFTRVFGRFFGRSPKKLFPLADSARPCAPG